MVTPEFLAVNAWIAAWSYASWNVDPDPLSVADELLGVLDARARPRDSRGHEAGHERRDHEPLQESAIHSIVASWTC